MDDRILRELVDGILRIVNNRVLSIILYGSVARGTNTDESDVDIAVLMDGNLNGDTEDKLAEFIVDMNLEYDKVFSVIDIDYAMFHKWEKVTPFYQNVNREGVVLWKAALMVYMVQYGTGDMGEDMDDAHKKYLKEIFDEMNSFENTTITTTIKAGQSLGNVVTNGYYQCSICCGQWAGGPTASGVMPTAEHTLAVDASNPFVPMGTKIIMNGIEYTVEDTGAFC